MRRDLFRPAFCGAAAMLAVALAAALGAPADAALRAPGCDVKYGDDGRAVFAAHPRDNIFQRLLVLAFPSRVPIRDLEIWTGAGDRDAVAAEWVWSVICPADVPGTARITFGDVPAGCTQLLPADGAPPPLQPGVRYGLTCSRGRATFVLHDGSITVDRD